MKEIKLPIEYKDHAPSKPHWKLLGLMVGIIVGGYILIGVVVSIFTWWVMF